MRRGQAEAVGLLVIVLLLLAAGLIVLRFSVQPSSTTLADTRSSLESTRLLQALILTTIHDKPFQEHAAACSTTPSTCFILRKEIENIFTILLKKGQRYSFFLTYQEQNILIIDQCPVGVLSSYSFAQDGGFYELKLRLCTSQRERCQKTFVKLHFWRLHSPFIAYLSSGVSKSL